MVKILSNGDIVQDDDPRAQKSAGSRGSSSARPRQVLISYNVLSKRVERYMYATCKW